MRLTLAVGSVAAAGMLGLSLAPPALADPAGLSAAELALGRQTLAPNDGWAAAGPGTTGGAAADDAHIFVAHNRAELVAALAGNTPKIVYVAGRVDANVDADNQPLGCADYADPAYSLPEFLAAYDPAVWGRVAPSGPLEDARARSAKNQSAQVKLPVGSNTTIIGRKGAKIVGGNLVVDKVTNVIVRNLSFEDAADCFPAWDPTDGDTGNWNSLYDNVSLTGATNVWFDHNTLTDAANQDRLEPLYFGRPYQVHDGLFDVTKASDYVTASFNNFFEHDKSILIGSTNTVGADVGHLRVTLHHNRFANLGQRVPRVRFGQVDVFDNYYYATDEDTFSYSWGVGVYSAIYAENNFFLRSADIPLDAFVYNWGGSGMTEKGTLVRVGTGPVRAVSLLDAFNAAHDPDLGPDAGWVPTLRNHVDPTAAVPAIVSARAGAGRL
jgi:pectate lyase